MTEHCHQHKNVEIRLIDENEFERNDRQDTIIKSDEGTHEQLFSSLRCVQLPFVRSIILCVRLPAHIVSAHYASRRLCILLLRVVHPTADADIGGS